MNQQLDAVPITTPHRNARDLARPTAAAPGLAPANLSERSEWLDALRGFALLGILLYNMQAFSGYLFRGLMPPSQLAWAALDPALDFIAHVLIQGKFYSLFSFLFGLGFALQLQRASVTGAADVSLLRRRLGWLFVFGLAHALLIWFGDILTVYAVFGFALLLFRNVSQRALLAWALAFLASPVLIYLVFLAVGLGDPLAGDPSTPPGESIVGKAVHTIVTGSYIDVVQSQFLFYPGGWLRRAVQLALPRIFGMFLLGAWVARIGLPAARQANRAMLRRWLVWGLALGLPVNIAFSMLGGNEALLPANATGLLAASLASLGMPLLCLAYVAMFALWWRTPRPQNLLVVAGRTALSQYLGQSIVCVTLFYGFGLGLFGRVSYGVALLIALVVFLLLSTLARAWLARFAQGPMEALWRRLSYRRAADRLSLAGDA
jgi:uncharacterized protein